MDFTMYSINQLKQLYERWHEDLKNVKQAFPDKFLNGPHLIAPPEIYFKQPWKLMIIGKETKGWESRVNDIDHQMQHYKSFNLGKDYYSSPFWNITRKLEKALGCEPYSCVWSNVNKFDLNGGSPKGEVASGISKLDSILVKEIEILRPDICIFFTGPTLNKRLRAIFDQIHFEPVGGWKKKQFSKLYHEKLPNLSIRVYHPNYLRLAKLENQFMATFQKLLGDL